MGLAGPFIDSVKAFQPANMPANTGTTLASHAHMRGPRMRRCVLQFITLCYITLYNIILHYITIYYITLHIITLYNII